MTLNAFVDRQDSEQLLFIGNIEAAGICLQKIHLLDGHVFSFLLCTQAFVLQAWGMWT